jgi:hypothetical protein
MSGPKAALFQPVGAVSAPTRTERALGAPPLARSTQVISGVKGAWVPKVPGGCSPVPSVKAL